MVKVGYLLESVDKKAELAPCGQTAFPEPMVGPGLACLGQRT